MIIDIEGKEETRGLVLESDRVARFGHRSAIVAVEDHESAVLLERELFDRGAAVAVVEGADAQSAHLAKVLQFMDARGLVLSRDAGDPYAQKLQEFVRTPRDARRLDRLLVAAVIEARSCERLALLAGGLTDETLRRFYRELAQSEDGHQSLFFRLAVNAHGNEAEVRERLDALLDLEARVIDEIGVRAAIH